MLQSDIPSELEMKMLDRLSNNGLSENPCEVVKFNDEPKIPTYVCLPNKHAQTTYLCNGAYGLGSALNPTPAKIKSIAEFLERLAIFNPQRKLFKKSKYIERSCTNPFLFARYSNIKAELENSTFLWSHAISYPDKKKIFVPAQSIYISDMFKYETKLASEYITTGAAFGNNFNDVLEGGLLEVVERDAFIISYLTKRKLNRIVHFSDKINSIINYLKYYYLDVFVYDITTNLRIPSFMTITVDRTGYGPAISVGLKAGFDNENTIFGSILESVQPRRQFRYNKEMAGDKFKFPTESEIISTTTRYFYWYPTKMIKNLNFWLKNSRTINFTRIPDYASSLKEGVKELKDHGYHIFYADMAQNETRKMGFVVGKVLIPELHPLYISENSKVLYSIHAGNIMPRRALKPHPFA